MKLDVKAFAIACGILWAIGIFILGLLGMNGYATAIVSVLGSGYLGYGPTFGGAIVGALWGFFDAFCFGWLLAWLYNKLAK